MLDLMETQTAKHEIITYRWLLRPGERRILLILIDFLVAVVALITSLFVWSWVDEYYEFNLEFLRTIPNWFFLLPFVWVILMVELYDEHRASNWKQTTRSIAMTALIGLGLYLVIYFFYSTPKSLNRRGVAGFIIAATALTYFWRLLYIRIFTAPEFMRRVLLVGAGETGQTLLKVFKTISPPPFFWVGMIDDDPDKFGMEKEGYRVLGSSEKLLEIIGQERVSDIIVAISGEMQGRMFQTLLDAQEMGIAITRMPVAYEELLGRVPIQHLEADWILRSFVDQARQNGFYELGKRLLDIAGGLVGCGIFLFFFPLIAIAILLDSGWPIFYKQTRSGRGGQAYKIFKFRTMGLDAEPDGQPQWAEENDKRATRVGRVLRKTHLDELPQFINVLKGEMSLVGPRAERPELVDWFQQHVPFYRARLLVKPGITGWAQVNFGYASTIEETITKLEYDLYYIKHRNLILDFVILLRTPATVFGLRGR
jgi:exopolysaccharide biosynthesis polyprenyl glycosylphosphotransferase